MLSCLKLLFLYLKYDSRVQEISRIMIWEMGSKGKER